MQRIQSYSALAATIALLTSAAVAQDTERDTRAGDHARSIGESGGGVRATDLIGARVQNAQGEDLGEIQDLFVSPEDRVVSAVLSVGGFLGFGDKLVAIPYEDLHISTDGNFSLPMTKDQLAAAPELAPGANSAVTIATHTGAPASGSQPDARAQIEASVEAVEIYAEDDPRVAEGIAENKEAYDEKTSETPREP